MTIQLAHKRVLAFIRGSSPAALEIDYMEYATDSTAQGAYVTSGGTTTVDSYTGTVSESSWRHYAALNQDSGQAFTLSATAIISKVAFNLKRLGSPTGNAQAFLYAATGTVGSSAMPTGSALASSNTVDISAISTSYTLIDFTFSSPYTASSGDYCVVFRYATGTDSSNMIKNYLDANGSDSGNAFRSLTAGSSWQVLNGATYDTNFVLYTTALNSFSESTIKTEGSYALKLEATTDALNETVTKTLTGGDILDLTGKNTIKLDARATGTGSNLELSIRDSGNENSGNLFIEAETDITDKNGTHTITANGDAALSKAQISSYNNSSASVIFDGTGDYLSVPTHADFDFGTGDWTVDFSFYTNTVTSANDGLFTLEAGTENILSVWVGNNVIFCKVNSSQQTITVSASTWYHLAIERYGNTVTAYLDGVAEQTWDVTGISFDDNSAGIEIGGYATVGTYTLDGYMDNFRIVKGTSIFQSAFTPSNTTLLYPEYQTHTIDIVAADTYQAEVVDISDIADADKDDIDLIQFKVLNEDSARTFYIDNIRASADEYAYLTATGGTITYDGDYKIHTFTEDGTFTVKSLGSTEDEVEYLVVGGGGGGGGYYYAGGGGAGGYRNSYASETSGGGGSTETPLSVTAQAYPITVGAGGAGGVGGTEGIRGTDGGDSIFSSITSVGGGGGGSISGAANGNAGGSGGGGGKDSGAGGAGTANQGYAGGSSGNVASGGGGASEVGGNGESLIGGDGGDGLSSSITGSPITRAGGGGGGSWGATGGSTGGSGGAGGGGVGSDQDPLVQAGDGTDNTGSGGGGGNGGSATDGGNGGSGIVIIRYQYK
jgi:hypothetical protein